MKQSEQIEHWKMEESQPFIGWDFSYLNVWRNCVTPGGSFLTQQIHGLWADDLLAVFDAKPQWPDSTPDKYVPGLKSAGLRIVETKDWMGRLAFTDVGVIVYYLKAVPWLVPGFSVDSHLNYLLKLQGHLEAGEALTF